MIRLHPVTVESDRFDSTYRVSVNDIPAELNTLRVSRIPYNIWWIGSQRNLDDTELVPMLSMDGEGEVVLSVTFPGLSASDELTVRPLSRGVKPVFRDGAAVFTLPAPGNYTFEVNGYHRALHIFYAPARDYLAEAKAERGERGIIYYPAGVYDLGTVELPSHTTVVLDPGAVVYGAFVAYRAEDVKITGYGIVDGSKEIRTYGSQLLPDASIEHSAETTGGQPTYLEDFYLDEDDNCREVVKKYNLLSGCIRFYVCKNCVLSGPILRDSSTFTVVPAACEDILIEWTRLAGMWRYNSDGIDIFNSSRVTIKNCFLRNFDDCVVVKGIKGWDKRNNSHITVDGCVVWCDWGRALEYGAETNADEFFDVTMKNCDVIHGADVMLDIQNHNRADVHDCVFDDIRVEYSRHHLPSQLIKKPYSGEEGRGQPHLICLDIVASGLFNNQKETGSIRNVTFRNIRVFADEGVNMPKVCIDGFDGTRVSEITLDGICFNGKRLSASDLVIIQKNSDLQIRVL